MKKHKENAAKLVAVLGFFFTMGTAGAVDSNAIGLALAIPRIVLGVVLFGGGILAEVSLQ